MTLLKPSEYVREAFNRGWNVAPTGYEYIQSGDRKTVCGRGAMMAVMLDVYPGKALHAPHFTFSDFEGGEQMLYNVVEVMGHTNIEAVEILEALEQKFDPALYIEDEVIENAVRIIEETREWKP